MKKYILIAGVNGAGKSTLFYSLDELRKIHRVNSDDIVTEIGSWKNPKDVFYAGKMAARKIREYFDEGLSFQQETTLCGNSILKNIRRAKELGYWIELHYVGVESVEIAKARVEYRVSRGGHDIPAKDIERRFVETFQNLNKVLNDCDRIAFYDNTHEFVRFAVVENGEMILLRENAPKWFEKVNI